MAPHLRVTEFTDPGCPFAFSAEPIRRKLLWSYGDAVEFRSRMVGLSSSPDEYERKGLSAEILNGAMVEVGEANGMPIPFVERERLWATMPACRAVVAARLHAPESERALLRAFRVRNFAGELLDLDETRDHAAADAGLDPAALKAWLEDDAVETALQEDLQAARSPTDAALAQDSKLADSEDGGRRYTCPSYEFERASDGAGLSAPGFQPWAVTDVATANLLPDVERRAPAEDPLEVLAWAGEPLAAQEVALVMDISKDDAEAKLREAGASETAGDWTAA